MKKKLDTKSIANELRGASSFFPSSPNATNPEPPSSPAQPETQQQEVTQKSTQVSKSLSNPLSRNLSKSLSKTPTTDEIETLDFRLRKVNKVRVNADVPEEWKARLDDIGYKLKVGKYQLMLYIIAAFLGKLEEREEE